MNEQSILEKGAVTPVSRRRFLGYAGALAGAGVIAGSFASCKKEEDPWEGSIVLGSNDIGVLNYAYALEQLEAAFYTQVLLTPYASMSVAEKDYLTAIQKHEVAHREFFRRVLGSNAIQDLTPNFTSIDFTKRTSVLDTAKTLEDLGVAAYNGAGRLLTVDAYLDVAGKIVSVEARHAALIRDLIKMGTFTEPSFASEGFDFFSDPKDVLGVAGRFIVERLNYTNLPTS